MSHNGASLDLFGGVDESVDVLVNGNAALTELGQPGLGLGLLHLGIPDGSLKKRSGLTSEW